MTYKTILVHCDAGRGAPARLELAASLAERHQAHLVGLHARPPFEPAVDGTGTFAMDLLFRDHEEALAASEAASAKAFAAAVKGKPIASEWRSAGGHADGLLPVHARYADLTVVGQDDPEPSAGLPPPSNLTESVAFGAGRAALVVPFIGASKSVGRNVLLCWNASREAARAAAEAMPFLQAAETVTVLIVDPRATAAGHGSEPGADVALWLSRHDVKVMVQRDVAADADVGGVILSRAMDHGCDLIVMGIYGHSRLRELVLGGASRTLLASMTVPVLMAH
ncbi:universal stress protein [Reyranella sp.]|uniref:universal stress protein n=1 Tax=Reyranella sp. TaxID=1929291 RepID=UPI0037839442